MLSYNYININGRLSAEDSFILYMLHEKVNRKKFFKKVDENVYKEIFFFDSLIKEYNRLRNDINFRNEINDWIKLNKESYFDFINNFIDKYPAKPVHWGDRQKSLYFNTKLEEGHQFEVYIDNEFNKKGLDIGLFYARKEQYKKGESEKGIEIKFDNRWEGTGNIYIEYQEKANEYSKKWVDSGILKADNTIYYLIGSRKKFWILRKSNLLDIYNIWRNDSVKKSNFREIGTSKGFLLTTKMADTMNLTMNSVISVLKQDL